MRNKSLFLFFSILLFTLIFAGGLYSTIPPEERAALIALYNSTNGDSWTNNNGWKMPPLDADGFADSGTEDNWFGITILGSHVLEIDLDNNQLSGSLPSQLGDLPELEELYLHQNQLTGTIPLEWGNLLKLEILNLSSNQLTGSIPPELGNLLELEEFYLYSNQLGGTIPPELGNLSYLLKLYFYSNQLTGSIPRELGNLLKLTELRLNDNQLTGSIPLELGRLSKLRYFFLHDNRLSGSIPRELGSLSNLVEFNFRSNQLTGEIPVDIASLSDLDDDGSDLRWNALYAFDETLKIFLESKQIGGNWEDTQSIAPRGVAARGTSTTSIEISWRPIAYTGDTGGYRVFYSSTPGPPYIFYDITSSKSDSKLDVTGLSAGSYYFVVQTRTDPHSNNSNTVDSLYSAEVFESTSGSSVRISGRITTHIGDPVEGVTLAFTNNGGTTEAKTDASGNYSHAVPYEWSGIVTPSKTGYTFDPPFIKYEKNITAHKPGQDYIGTSSRNFISGRVTIARNTGIEVLAGVKVTFSGKDNVPIDPIDTDDDGFYQYEVRTGWSGTVEPLLSGHTFYPTEQEYEDVQSPMPYQNYTATEDRPIISGRVTTIQSGDIEGLGGVNMTFSGQNGNGTTKTNDNGYYRITVDSDWSGTVTPKKEGFHFSPPNTTYGEGDIVNRLCENYEAFSGEITLTLTALWKVDNILFISEHYGELELTVKNPEAVEVSRYIIFRKEENTDYEIIKTIPADEISMNEPYTHEDRGLDRDKKYTYIARAYNVKNEPIAVSAEEPIQ